MGVTTQLSRFVVAGSVGLAVLTGQGWWSIDWYPANTVPGQHVHALAYVGDGNLVLIGAAMTLALGLLAILPPESRRFAGAAIALTGAAMFGVTMYDIVNVPSLSDTILDAFIAKGSPTTELYLASLASILIGLAGAIIAAARDEQISRYDSDEGVEAWA